LLVRVGNPPADLKTFLKGRLHQLEFADVLHVRGFKTDETHLFKSSLRV